MINMLCGGANGLEERDHETKIVSDEVESR